MNDYHQRRSYLRRLDSTNDISKLDRLDSPGNRNSSSRPSFQGASPRGRETERAGTFRKRNAWGAVKWLLFSMLIGGVAGSAVAIEYYRSVSPIEKIPDSIATSEPVNPTRPSSTFQIPASGPELIPTPVPSSTLTPSSTPTPLAPAPTLTAGQIFAMNDRGEISDAEAQRLLSKITYYGENEGELIGEAKGILERVWAEEGRGKQLFITLTYVPIHSPDTDGFFQLEFEEPNKATIVIPDEPTELSNGLVYAISFVSLVMASADDAYNIPESKYRSIYEYATDYEVNEIWNDCAHLDTIYCSLFMSYSRAPS